MVSLRRVQCQKLYRPDLEKSTGWADTYTGVLASTTAFTAPGSCNDTFYFRIKALENGGTNAIVYSDSIAIVPFDTIRPAKPAITFVTVLSNKSVQVNWTKSVSNDVKNYNVYRNGIKIASLGNLTTYTDTGINTSKSYCYAVEAQDSCAGNLSGLSPLALHCCIEYCHQRLRKIHLPLLEQIYRVGYGERNMRYTVP